MRFESTKEENIVPNTPTYVIRSLVRQGHLRCGEVLSVKLKAGLVPSTSSTAEQLTTEGVTPPVTRQVWELAGLVTPGIVN